MTDSMLELFPDAHVYYLGLYREKATLTPVECECINNPFVQRIKTPSVLARLLQTAQRSNS